MANQPATTWHYTLCADIFERRKIFSRRKEMSPVWNATKIENRSTLHLREYRRVTERPSASSLKGITSYLDYLLRSLKSCLSTVFESYAKTRTLPILQHCDLRAKQAYKPWKSSVFCFQNGVSFDKKMNCIIGQLSIAYHKSVVYNNCEERSKSNQ